MLVVADKFGQLPDTVEREMSEYWFNRTLLWIRGMEIDEKRRLDLLKKKKGGRS